MLKDSLCAAFDTISPSDELLDRISAMMKEEAAHKKAPIKFSASRYAGIAAAVAVIAGSSAIVGNLTNSELPSSSSSSSLSAEETTAAPAQKEKEAAPEESSFSPKIAAAAEEDAPANDDLFALYIAEEAENYELPDEDDKNDENGDMLENSLLYAPYGADEEEVFPMIAATGMPQSYEDLASGYLGLDIYANYLNFVTVEIIEQIDPTKASEITGESYFAAQASLLFKARVTRDLLFGEDTDIELYLSCPAFEAYGIGETFAALIGGFSYGEYQSAVGELKFALNYSEDGSCTAISSMPLDIGALESSDGYSYDLDELADFLRNDWQQRGFYVRPFNELYRDYLSSDHSSPYETNDEGDVIPIETVD